MTRALAGNLMEDANAAYMLKVLQKYAAGRWWGQSVTKTCCGKVAGAYSLSACLWWTVETLYHIWYLPNEVNK